MVERERLNENDKKGEWGEGEGLRLSTMNEMLLFLISEKQHRRCVYKNKIKSGETLK